MATEEAAAASQKRPTKQFFDPKVGGESSGNALLNLAFYSFLIFTVPLAVFFLVKQLLEEHEFQSIYIRVMPAIASIVSVNVIIVLYIISAFKQDRRDRELAQKTD